MKGSASERSVIIGSVGGLSLAVRVGNTSKVTMKIEVHLFAAIRDAAGSDTITVDVADRPCADDILQAVGRRIPEIAGLLPSCRLAVDCCYVTPETRIGDDGEIALIPPVSGG